MICPSMTMYVRFEEIRKLSYPSSTMTPASQLEAAKISTIPYTPMHLPPTAELFKDGIPDPVAAAVGLFGTTPFPPDTVDEKVVMVLVLMTGVATVLVEEEEEENTTVEVLLLAESYNTGPG